MTNLNSLLNEQSQWRYAVKKFDSTRKISASDWETLQNTLVLSPSSYGLQPWKFLIIQTPAVRKQLTPASWNQTQVEDCSHYVVLTAKTSVDEAYINEFIASAAKTRGVPAEKMAGYRDMMLGDLVKGGRAPVINHWAARQCYIALGNLMTTAALLKIDSCPMEGFVPDQYDEILKLKGTGYTSIVCCALGYRHAEDAYAKLAKVRFDAAKVVSVI